MLHSAKNLTKVSAKNLLYCSTEEEKELHIYLAWPEGELSSLGKLRSRMSLFSRELGQSSASRGSGPAAAEAARRLRSWDRRWSSLTRR